MTTTGLDLCIKKMRDNGASDTAVTVFSHYYRQYQSGVSGLIAENDITPLTQVPQLSEQCFETSAQAEALGKTALIKLNGGLGTSMGLEKAKSLIEIRQGQSFLDIICRQVLAAREEYQVRLPLIFMNSFRTRQDTLAALAKYPTLPVAGLPLDFLQNQIPKILVDNLEPVSWPDNPSLEWCPPGHGDIYVALYSSGLLKKLLEQGFEYVCVSNSDNLGAAPDGQLAAWFAQSQIPFAMEVCQRTVNDRKGGHLAVRKADGQLILRESAQTAPQDQVFFTDEHRHRFFNTNTLWFNLAKLSEALANQNGVLGLPLIANLKTADPSDLDSPKVVQLETAMGTAVEVFAGAQAIEVPRQRFLPVKTTNELTLLRSDLYILDAKARLMSESTQLPEIRLDPTFYGRLADYQVRFPAQGVSLRSARSFKVSGDWYFSAKATITGEAEAFPNGQSNGITGATFSPSA